MVVIFLQKKAFNLDVNGIFALFAPPLFCFIANTGVGDKGNLTFTSSTAKAPAGDLINWTRWSGSGNHAVANAPSSCLTPPANDV